jgi:hypothetical protein
VAKVVFGHPLRGKALLEMRTYLSPVEVAEPPDGPDGFSFSIHDKAGHAVIDDFRYRAGPERDNRRACVYRKSKSERIDDEVRPVWRANLWRRIAEPDER